MSLHHWKAEEIIWDQEHNGEHLPLIRHEQIRWEIMKPEGNAVARLTFCMNTGHPTTAN